QLTILQKKRRSYTVAFKLEVIEYTKRVNNIKAVYKYGLDHKPLYPLAEEALKYWIDKLCNEGIAVLPST
ncbi:20831_t:CDS:2, partial [Racocetra persica]